MYPSRWHWYLENLLKFSALFLGSYATVCIKEPNKPYST
jgi:hypothetical protein